MIPEYFIPPQGWEETEYPDGSEWVHRSGSRHVFRKVVGVLYDRQLSNGIRESDKILCVSVDPLGRNADNPQHRDGKVVVMTRYQMQGAWRPRPQDAWIRGAHYRLRKGDGRTGPMKALHVFESGDAVLVSLYRAESVQLPQAHRSYWVEVNADDPEPIDPELDQ